MVILNNKVEIFAYTENKQDTYYDVVLVHGGIDFIVYVECSDYRMTTGYKNNGYVQCASQIF